MKRKRLIIVGTVLLAGIVIFALLRRPVSSTDTGTATLEMEGQLTTLPVAVLINGQPLESYQESANPQLPQSAQSLSKIDLNEISYFETHGSSTVIVFNDGSRTTVSPALLDNLQSQVRQRLEYRRGH
jgi:hypothetical protein